MPQECLSYCAVYSVGITLCFAVNFSWVNLSLSYNRGNEDEGMVNEINHPYDHLTVLVRPWILKVVA